jgi:hypothetical protein
VAKTGQTKAGQINASQITTPGRRAFTRGLDGSGWNELQFCMRRSLDNVAISAKRDVPEHASAGLRMAAKVSLIKP